MSKTVALVACVSKKSSVPRPARDLYESDWFLKSSAYAEQTADQWFILSAKYGLVDPQKVIAPYDVTLNRMPANDRRVWAYRVMSELGNQVSKGDRIVFLAGEKYRERLIEPLEDLGCNVEIPMKGLRIGEQLRWLKQRVG